MTLIFGIGITLSCIDGSLEISDRGVAAGPCKKLSVTGNYHSCV